MINFKILFSYEKNIAFNEMPIIFYEKEKSAPLNNSINFVSNSENSMSNYVLRESALYPFPKRNSAIGSLPMQKNGNNNSLLSLLDASNNSYSNGNLTANKVLAPMNSYIMFEESDDSSIEEEEEESSSSKSESEK